MKVLQIQIKQGYVELYIKMLNVQLRKKHNIERKFSIKTKCGRVQRET